MPEVSIKRYRHMAAAARAMANMIVAEDERAAAMWRYLLIDTSGMFTPP